MVHYNPHLSMESGDERSSVGTRAATAAPGAQLLLLLLGLSFYDLRAAIHTHQLARVVHVQQTVDLQVGVGAAATDAAEAGPVRRLTLTHLQTPLHLIQPVLDHVDKQLCAHRRVSNESLHSYKSVGALMSD